ncbi:6-pyruvoyl trahydropterin synthase family protein [Macrococcoides bohemicum]|uniref:6-pyruvoyl trahydropterin synthase family protein n=1 Tax=Macrococcoides bohemicum TaxID=1903056 RepID=UPI0019400760|nr:6-carboxytetrahydropterin synthase [Macrococcus bohemicus]QRN49171.1 6-carboxytetrahydropterin synthase [Macrococcus bohemicus]
MNPLEHIQQPQQTSYYQKDILLNLSFTFTTTNRIFFPNGKHKDLFNHNYKFDISIKSPVDTYGLAIDFYKIERDYNEKIAPLLNAPILNESLPVMNTTVENIAYFIWQQLELLLDEHSEIQTLTLYETIHHSVTLNKDMMQ